MERLWWVTISGHHVGDGLLEPRYMARGTDPERIAEDAIIRRKTAYGPDDAFFIGVTDADAGTEDYAWCHDVYPDASEKESRLELGMDERLPWEVY